MSPLSESGIDICLVESAGRLGVRRSALCKKASGADIGCARRSKRPIRNFTAMETSESKWNVWGFSRRLAAGGSAARSVGDPAEGGSLSKNEISALPEAEKASLAARLPTRFCGKYRRAEAFKALACCAVGSFGAFLAVSLVFADSRGDLIDIAHVSAGTFATALTFFIVRAIFRRMRRT